jgi:hypothetical protein
MLGARRQSVFVLAYTAWCFGSIVPCIAGEFGNMQFPSVQKQSGEASALALEAISTALKGIAELERAQPDTSKGLLTTSADQLMKAASEMESILSRAASDQQFKSYLEKEPNRQGINSDDWEFFTKSLAKDNLPTPKNRREVFGLFIKKTRTLSAGLQNPQRRLGDIGDYLRFGSIVTRLMRQ